MMVKQGEYSYIATLLFISETSCKGLSVTSTPAVCRLLIYEHEFHWAALWNRSVWVPKHWIFNEWNFMSWYSRAHAFHTFSKISIQMFTWLICLWFLSNAESLSVFCLIFLKEMLNDQTNAQVILRCIVFATVWTAELVPSRFLFNNCRVWRTCWCRYSYHSALCLWAC